MCPIRPAEPGDSWSERECERTLPYPHLRCARTTHCKLNWKENAHAPSFDACSGRPAKRNRQQRLRAKTRNDTGIMIAVQRKIEAKCMMLWSRGALIVVFHHVCVRLLNSSVMICARCDHLARDLQHIILDTLQCLASQKGSTNIPHSH